MAKRQTPARKGKPATPPTRSFFLQIQWSLAGRLDPEAVVARIHAVAAGCRARAWVAYCEAKIAVDVDTDIEDPTQPFTDLLIEATDGAELWAGLRALLDDPEIGPGLRRSTVVTCDRLGAGILDPGLRLYTFERRGRVDEFQ